MKIVGAYDVGVFCSSLKVFVENCVMSWILLPHTHTIHICVCEFDKTFSIDGIYSTASSLQSIYTIHRECYKVAFLFCKYIYIKHIYFNRETCKYRNNDICISVLFLKIQIRIYISSKTLLTV